MSKILETTSVSVFLPISVRPNVLREYKEGRRKRNMVSNQLVSEEKIDEVVI